MKVKRKNLLLVNFTIFTLIVVINALCYTIYSTYLSNEDYAESERCPRCWIWVAVEGYQQPNGCIEEYSYSNNHGEESYYGCAPAPPICFYCTAYYYFDQWVTRDPEKNCVIKVHHYGIMEVTATTGTITYFEEWDAYAVIPP